MLRVAVDISPTKTGHRLRGIGSYTQHLTIHLERIKGVGEEFIFFENPATPPPADVIHHPYFDLFLHTLSIKKRSNRVVTIHDVIPLIFPEHFPVGVRGFLNFYLQKKALKNTDIIICDSQISKQDIADKLSFPQDQIKVIYLAAGENFKKIIDIQRMEKVEQKYLLPKNFILYVGDVNWHKNIEGLIHAVKLAKVNLVLTGEALDNANLIQTQNINKLIKKLNLEKKIIKTKYVSEQDLIILYNLADLTVLPSFYEGFGLPVLESMACQTPVVCSDKGSLKEIIGDDLAFVCDPANPESIALKIEQALSLSASGREKLGERLQKHASKFSWSKTAQETVEVYKLAAKNAISKK